MFSFSPLSFSQRSSSTWRYSPQRSNIVPPPFRPRPRDQAETEYTSPNWAGKLSSTVPLKATSTAMPSSRTDGSAASPSRVTGTSFTFSR